MEIVPLNSLPKICHNTSATEHKSESMLQRCEGCMAVRYCGKEHQKEDWPNHKELCQLLKELNKQNVSDISLQDKIIKHLKNEICAGQAFTASQIILASASIFPDVRSKSRLFHEVFEPLYAKNHRVLQSMNVALNTLEVDFSNQKMMFNGFMKEYPEVVLPDLKNLSEEEFEEYLEQFFEDSTIESLLTYAKSHPDKKEMYLNRAYEVLNRVNRGQNSDDFFYSGCLFFAEYFDSVGERSECKKYCLLGLQLGEGITDPELKSLVSDELDRLRKLLDKQNSFPGELLILLSSIAHLSTGQKI